MTKEINCKIHSIESLASVIRGLHKDKQKIVFTNGCFDIIHTGHTRYLSEARSAGDYLVVAVNSDESVSSLKGDKRPIVPLEERMEVLAALHFVDFVISFSELDPYNVIKKLKPDVLIKGGDWPVDKIIGRDVVEENGGSVFTIPEIPGQSTTGIINKILKINS